MKREQLIVAGISDLHGQLLHPDDMPEADVLCICGDILPLEIQNDNLASVAWLCRHFFAWIDMLPYKQVFMIWGNHDFVGEWLRIDQNGQHRKPKRVLTKLCAPSKLRLLDDNEVIYNGYRFYGSPWCPELQRWAFYADHDQLVEKFNKIPANTDVLLTHCPPRIERYGLVQQQGWNYMTDFGSFELACQVAVKRPQLHLFGHVHSGDHIPQTINQTTFCNVSLKDEEYKVSYEPKTFIIT